MLQYCSEGASSDRGRLETIFRSRFSSPNIEDEYSYNLSYLVSHNLFGSRNGLSGSSHINRSFEKKRQNNSHVTPSISRKHKEYNDDVPVKQCAKHNTKAQGIKPYSSKKFSQRKSSLTSSQLREPLVMRDICMSSKVETLESRTQERISDVNLGLPTRKAYITTSQPSQSSYPGLHIYVTETPPRPFYDVISEVENPTQYFKTKNMDFISELNKSKNISRMHENKRETTGVFKGNLSASKNRPDCHCVAQESTTLDAMEFPSVASRIEALLSTMQLQGGYQETDVENERNFTMKDRSSHSNSIDEPPKPHKTTRLQRSATFSTNRNKISTNVQTSEYCFTCCKRTYAVDRITIGDRSYHKGCFRCATCLRTLLPGTFASLDGIILCKPHYIEQFRRAGRYEVRKSLIRSDDSESACTTNFSGDE